MPREATPTMPTIHDLRLAEHAAGTARTAEALALHQAVYDGALAELAEAHAGVWARRPTTVALGPAGVPAAGGGGFITSGTPPDPARDRYEEACRTLEAALEEMRPYLVARNAATQVRARLRQDERFLEMRLGQADERRARLEGARERERRGLLGRIRARVMGTA